MSHNNVAPNLFARGNINPSSFVKLYASADNSGVQCGANEQMIGISQEGAMDPQGVTGASTYAAVDGVSFRLYGLGDICKLKAGSGGYTRGDRLKSDSSGYGVPIAGTGANQNVGALALESAAEGELGRVQIILLSIEPDSEAVTYFADDQALQFGTGQDTSLEWSTNDASDHSLVLGLGDTSQMLHITDLAAKDSDWAITSPTHPNIYLHSNTTPITDYLRLGNHTGTVADIDVVGGTTLQLQIDGTNEVTMTASQLNVLDGNSLIVGGSTAVTAGNTPTAQITGTTAADASLLLACFSATDSTRGELAFLKSGAATIGAGGTIVATGESLGGVVWYVDDGGDLLTPAASIEALALATQGANDSPGALQVNCTADGSNTVAEVGRFTNANGLTLGVAGTKLGKLQLCGNTSGTVTINTAAAAGTWTLTLPADDGDAGEQLQTDGSGVATWEAAGSLRAVKDLLEHLGSRASEALQRVLGAGVYAFRYKEGARPTTRDHETVYHGVLAEEYPQVMHHHGRIFSPVSAFGETVLALQAMAQRVERLEAAQGI